MGGYMRPSEHKDIKENHAGGDGFDSQSSLDLSE